MKAYEYRHVVSFDETNLVGNVHYTHLVRWQGRCRELFLRDHAPDVAAQLQVDLALVTLHCSSEFLAELSVFDEVSVRMTLADRTANRISLAFELWRESPSPRLLVARGEQSVASLRRANGRLEPVPLPADLERALAIYAAE